MQIKITMKKLKIHAQSCFAVLLLMTMISCNQISEKHLKMESDKQQLEVNLNMYKTVWDKIINDRQIDLINADSFDENITAIATSDGDIIGLENFKNYWLGGKKAKMDRKKYFSYLYFSLYIQTYYL